MRRVLQTLLIVGFLGTAASCLDGGTKTGNGFTVGLRAISTYSMGPMMVASKATTTAAPKTFHGDLNALVAPDAQGTLFEIDSARMYLRGFDVKLPDGEDCSEVSEEELDSDDEETADVRTISCLLNTVSIEGPYAADLITGALTPPLDPFKMPSGIYDQVDARFEPGDVVDGVIQSGDPLDGNTIHLTGRFRYDGRPRTFEVLFDFNETAVFGSVDGVEVTTMAPNNLWVSLDAAQWFILQPITQCLDDGELTIVDDHLLLTDSAPGGNCSGLKAAIRDAIKNSGEVE